MSRPKKTWRQKLQEDRDLPKMIQLEGAAAERWGAGTMVVPAPREVDALMRQIPKGRLVTTDVIRRCLAAKHEADLACPLTTGIFSWIAAHAAAEGAAAGEKKTTPYWRTLKTGGELNPKFPGGLEAVSERLREEGHVIEQRGKRMFVRDYQRKLLVPAAD